MQASELCPRTQWSKLRPRRSCDVQPWWRANVYPAEEGIWWHVDSTNPFIYLRAKQADRER